jgi:asparagine synthase (glutamine-hydrolysing)
MCGICGIVNYADRPTPDADLVQSMIGQLHHRGPDSSRMYMDYRAILGHTRLAIIDLETGAQPLSNENETLWITYNGELYNYIELRAELLAAGHKFKTKSDTEVFVHAYEEWGTQCFNRFNGQWAASIWDTKNNICILSRDRAGIRPLYYTFHKGRLHFASEVKAIFADRSIPRMFDIEGLQQIFTFWCTVAPRTVFAGIKQLPPAHFAILRCGPPKEQSFKTEMYWRSHYPPKQPGNALSIKDAEEKFRNLLIEAVQIRFNRSDVPVGAYLSGGLDSSISSAIISKYTNTPLNTFSVQFADSNFDESRYQKIMATRLGTKHQCVSIQRSEIGEVFPEVMWHAEHPILRSAPAPLFLLSKLVRASGYKVVVTGEGADEVLAGYDIFREAKAREFIARNPTSSKRSEIVSFLYPWMDRAPGQAPAFARAFFSNNLDPKDRALSHRTRWETTAKAQMILSRDVQNLIGKTSIIEKLIADMPKESDGWDVSARAQSLETTTILAGYILSSQGDRMLMANSIEGRFPFLDVNIVEYANSLPSQIKLMGLNEKYILKKAFSNILPAEIISRPKQPYRAPDAGSFFSTAEPAWLGEITKESYVEESGIINPFALALLMKKGRKCNGMSMSNTDNMRIVGALSTLLCHEYFIKGDSSSYRRNKAPKTLTVINRR